MGQMLHGSARTTEAVHRAIQHRQESIAMLAERYGIHPKTVAKGKKRPCVHDAPMGPQDVRSTILKPTHDLKADRRSDGGGVPQAYAVASR
jgi:hypothetical protein